MFKFTSNEVRDLIISFLVISLCFTLIYTGGNISAINYILPLVMIGVGFGFILHELGHKFASMHYGFWAEYKLWPTGLILAIITSCMGFVFAAPGAVYTYSYYLDDKKNGVISIAGPIVNILLALVFLGVAIVIYPSITMLDTNLQLAFLTCVIGFNVNSYLALFNLIPLGNLDGSKVLRWSGLIWLCIIAIAGLMVVAGQFVGVENIVRIILGI